MTQLDPIYIEYSRKWDIKPETVRVIYMLVGSNGNQFEKSREALEGMGIAIPARQIRYFYHKVRLHERLDIDRKGKPKNYRDMLRRG